MPKANSTGYEFVVLNPRWKDKPPQARFVRRGFAKRWMQHQLGEPGFEAEHHGLMAGAASNTLDMPKRRPLIGHIDECYASIGQLARDYFDALSKDDKHPRTIADRRRYIEQALRVVLPGEVNDRPVAHWGIERLGVRRMRLVRDACPDPVRPLSNNGNRRYRDQHVWAFRAMFNWGIESGWQANPEDELTALKFNPAAPLKPLSSNGAGWHVWTVDELHAFIERHPPGTMAHLTLMLLLFTVVRRSDVRALRQADDGRRRARLRGNQGARGHAQARRIEVRDELRAIIDAMPRDKQGRTPLGAANVPDLRDRAPLLGQRAVARLQGVVRRTGIPHRSMHGVRKFVATAAGASGQSDLAIASLLGHTTTKNVGVYTKDVRKDALFEQGIAAVLGLTQTTRAPKRVQLKLAA